MTYPSEEARRAGMSLNQDFSDFWAAVNQFGEAALDRLGVVIELPGPATNETVMVLLGIEGTADRARLQISDSKSSKCPA